MTYGGCSGANLKQRKIVVKDNASLQEEVREIRSGVVMGFRYFVKQK